jgi:hypothetical protein
MPINTDLSQLVFRKSIIAEKYKGGLEQFKEDFEFSSGKYNMEDNELISFVAMNAEDLDLTTLCWHYVLIFTFCHYLPI